MTGSAVAVVAVTLVCWALVVERVIFWALVEIFLFLASFWWAVVAELCAAARLMWLDLGRAEKEIFMVVDILKQFKGV
jgi:hypothetical protein